MEEQVRSLVAALQGLPPPLVVFIISTLPILELRGGIIAGLGIMDRPILEVVFAALLGNIASITPVVLVGKFYEDRLRKSRATGWLVNWTLSRAERRRGWIDRWGAAGLFLFVGIPLPGSGAWTGTAISIRVGMKLLPTLVAIYGGTCLAAAIMTGLTMFTKAGIKALGGWFL